MSRMELGNDETVPIAEMKSTLQSLLSGNPASCAAERGFQLLRSWVLEHDAMSMSPKDDLGVYVTPGKGGQESFFLTLLELVERADGGDDCESLFLGSKESYFQNQISCDFKSQYPDFPIPHEDALVALDIAADAGFAAAHLALGNVYRSGRLGAEVDFLTSLSHLRKAQSWQGIRNLCIIAQRDAPWLSRLGYWKPEHHVFYRSKGTYGVGQWLRIAFRRGIPQEIAVLVCSFIMTQPNDWKAPVVSSEKEACVELRRLLDLRASPQELLLNVNASRVDQQELLKVISQGLMYGSHECYVHLWRHGFRLTNTQVAEWIERADREEPASLFLVGASMLKLLSVKGAIADMFARMEGREHEGSLGFPLAEEQGRSYLDSACEAQHPYALLLMGELLLEDERSCQRGIEMLLCAASQLKDHSAHLELGEYYHKQQNTELAVHHYRKARELGTSPMPTVALATLFRDHPVFWNCDIHDVMPGEVKKSIFSWLLVVPHLETQLPPEIIHEICFWIAFKGVLSSEEMRLRYQEEDAIHLAQI